MMKRMIFLLLVLLVLFGSCTKEDSSLTDPDNSTDPNKITTLEVWSDNYWILDDGSKYHRNEKSDVIGTTLDGEYQYCLLLIKGDGSKEMVQTGFDVMVADSGILAIDNLKVSGLKIGTTKVTIVYEDLSITLDAYTQYRGEGLWSKYFSDNNGKNWLPTATVKFSQIPEESYFGEPPDRNHYIFVSPTSKKFLYGGEFINNNEFNITIPDGTPPRIYKFIRIE